MISSRWQKRNTTLYPIAMLIVICSGSAFFLPLDRFGFEYWESVLTSASVFIGLIVLAFTIARSYGNTMIRVLQYDSQFVDRELQFLLKRNSIRYIRKHEDDVYRYQFPGRKALDMCVEEYGHLNTTYNNPSEATVFNYTIITLSKLSESNKQYAAEMAELIDAMDEKLLEKSSALPS